MIIPQDQIGFKFYWVIYFFVLGIVGGIIISLIDGVSFLNSVFVALSACTGAGLSPKSMLDFSTGSFVTMSILSILGSPQVLLLIMTLYRRSCFHACNTSLLNKGHHPRNRVSLPLQSSTPEHVLEIDEVKLKSYIIQEYYQLDESLSLLNNIFLCYLFISISIGCLLLYGALFLHANQPELQQRGYSRFDSAVFLSITAFCNSGLTLTSDSLIGLANNQCATIVLSLLVLIGNTALPIILRCIISVLLSISMYYKKSYPSDAYFSTYFQQLEMSCDYILAHPNYLCTHIFSYEQTKSLAIMNITLIIIQYLSFLAGTMNRPDVTKIYPNYSELATIGYFQTMSVRAAGFTIIDLRLLNQGINIFHSLSYTNDQLIPDRSNNNSYYDKNISNNNNNNHEINFDEKDLIENNDDIKEEKTEQTTSLMQHFVYRHSFFLALSIIICAFSEDHLLSSPTSGVNLWYIMFEGISAYGNVGLSMGLPGKSYSLSGAFSPVGKLVMMFLMLLGKHRGLPSSHDMVRDFKFDEYLNAWN
eukprot:gene6615-9082_t